MEQGSNHIIMAEVNAHHGAARAQFKLAGPSRSYDPVHQAIRPDLADAAEANHHFAPHYAVPAEWTFTRDSRILANASDDAVVHATAHAGDGFSLLDLTGGWAWGYTIDGHVVGYVRAEDIAPKSSA